MPQYFLFDIDGTLLDSVDLHAQAWAEILKKFGFDVPASAIRTQIGKGGDELLPVFVPKDVLERDGERMKAERSELFKKQYLPRVRPFPKVRELFERLTADGKRVALASSGKQDEVKEYKRIAGISDLVDEHTSADDVEKSKPHPDIFLAALDQLGNPDRQRVLAIGDTPYDAEAAGKAGLRTIGLLCGGFPAEDLKKAGCVALFRDPADLLANYAAWAEG